MSVKYNWSMARFVVECLLEGYYKSVTPSEFQTYMFMRRQRLGCTPTVVKDTDGEPTGVVVLHFNQGKHVEEAIKAARLLGWFPVLIGSGAKYDIPYEQTQLEIFLDRPVSVSFEGRYDQVDPRAPATGSVYHVTLTRKVPSIRDEGLTPRHGNKITTHPDRVYVCYSLAAAEEIAAHMYLEVGNVTVLRIDRGALGEIYKDPNYTWKGGYVRDSIPRTAISVHAEDQPGHQAGAG